MATLTGSPGPRQTFQSWTGIRTARAAAASGPRAVIDAKGIEIDGPMSFIGELGPSTDIVVPAPACDHSLAVSVDHDSLYCTQCSFTVSGQYLRAAGFVRRGGKYDPYRNTLADECGRLRDEVRDLEVENSRLRRQVERLERKGGRDGR